MKKFVQFFTPEHPRYLKFRGSWWRSPMLQSQLSKESMQTGYENLTRSQVMEMWRAADKMELDEDHHMMNSPAPSGYYSSPCVPGGTPRASKALGRFTSSMLAHKHMKKDDNRDHLPVMQEAGQNVKDVLQNTVLKWSSSFRRQTKKEKKKKEGRKEEEGVPDGRKMAARSPTPGPKPTKPPRPAGSHVMMTCRAAKGQLRKYQSGFASAVFASAGLHLLCCLGTEYVGTRNWAGFGFRVLDISVMRVEAYLCSKIWQCVPGKWLNVYLSNKPIHTLTA